MKAFCQVFVNARDTQQHYESTMLPSRVAIDNITDRFYLSNVLKAVILHQEPGALHKLPRGGAVFKLVLSKVSTAIPSWY